MSRVCYESYHLFEVLQLCWALNKGAIALDGRRHLKPCLRIDERSASLIGGLFPILLNTCIQSLHIRAPWVIVCHVCMKHDNTMLYTSHLQVMFAVKAVCLYVSLSAGVWACKIDTGAIAPVPLLFSLLVFPLLLLPLFFCCRCVHYSYCRFSCC